LREKSKLSAKCNLCLGNKILKTGGCSTKSLHDHLNALHKINLRKQTGEEMRQENLSLKLNDQQEQQLAKKNKIEEYFNKEERSLPTILARMTARDGLPFRIFCSSPDLCEALRSRGFSDLPTFPTIIQNLVIKHAEKICCILVGKMKKEKDIGKKFSITLDE